MIDIKPSASDYLQRSSSTTINNITMLFAGNFLCKILSTSHTQKVAKKYRRKNLSYFHSENFHNSPFSIFHHADSSYKSSWGAHTTQPAGNYHTHKKSLSSPFNLDDYPAVHRRENSSLPAMSNLLWFLHLYLYQSSRCEAFQISHTRASLVRLLATLIWGFEEIKERFSIYSNELSQVKPQTQQREEDSSRR